MLASFRSQGSGLFDEPVKVAKMVGVCMRGGVRPGMADAHCLEPEAAVPLCFAALGILPSPRTLHVNGFAHVRPSSDSTTRGGLPTPGLCHGHDPSCRRSDAPPSHGQVAHQRPGRDAVFFAARKVWGLIAQAGIPCGPCLASSIQALSGTCAVARVLQVTLVHDTTGGKALGSHVVLWAAPRGPVLTVF